MRGKKQDETQIVHLYDVNKHVNISPQCSEVQKKMSMSLSMQYSSKVGLFCATVATRTRLLVSKSLQRFSIRSKTCVRGHINVHVGKLVVLCHAVRWCRSTGVFALFYNQSLNF